MTAGWGIPCPACGSEASGVVDTRAANGYVRRRRVCEVCAHRYTTREVLHEELPTLPRRVRDALDAAIDRLGEPVPAEAGR